MQHPVFGFFFKCVLQNATLTGKWMKIKSKKMENITWKFYLWNLWLNHKNRISSQRPSKWAVQYNLQLCGYRHLRATLLFSAMCSVPAGRHCWLYMLTYTLYLLCCPQKAQFTQIFTTEDLRLNNFESLRCYQFAPWVPQKYLYCSSG